MRKMYSKKQLFDLVNEGIDSGDIHADTSTEVKVADINSELATAGKVIKANGEGGAVWGDIPEELPSVSGNAGKFLKVNSGASGVEWGEIPQEYEKIDLTGENFTTLQQLYEYLGGDGSSDVNKDIDLLYTSSSGGMPNTSSFKGNVSFHHTYSTYFDVTFKYQNPFLTGRVISTNFRINIQAGVASSQLSLYIYQIFTSEYMVYGYIPLSA